MNLDKILSQLDTTIKKDVADITKGTFDALKKAKMTPELRKDLKTKQRFKPRTPKLSPTHTRNK